MSLRGNDLEDVAGADVLLAAAYRSLVAGLAEQRDALAGGARRGDGADAGRKRTEQVGRDRIGLLVVARLGDHHERLADVVEDDHDRGREKAHGRDRGAVRQPHRRLELGDGVVGRIADGTAAKSRQRRGVDVGVLGERLPERAEQVTVPLLDLLAARGHEREPPDLLPALDRLEQEAALAPLADAQVGGDRRQQIGR